MQVEPITPTLHAPGTKRLKLKYHELLSSVAFKFNLRRYNLVFQGDGFTAARAVGDAAHGRVVQLDPKPTSKAPGSKRSKLEYVLLLLLACKFCFQFHVRRYSTAVRCSSRALWWTSCWAAPAWRTRTTRCWSASVGPVEPMKPVLKPRWNEALEITT